MKFTLAAGVALAIGAQPVRAQDSVYHAKHVEPHGPQVVAIYIGATDCAPCVWPPLKEAVHAAWPLLEAQALKAGLAFATLGIAMDEDVTSGVALLQPLDQFDEVAIGAGWVNHGVADYIWADTSATSGIPQIVVVQRTVGTSSDKSEWSVSPYQVLDRHTGADAIRRWVAQGAPVAALVNAKAR